MKAINRKLLRELSHMRGQVASIGLVVAAGVALMVSFAGALISLQDAADAFYRQARLADVFTALTRAPESLAARVRSIPGVAAVDTRVVTDARLALDDAATPATGRFISLPDGGTPLNQPVVRRGDLPVVRRGDLPGRRAAGEARQALVSEGFAIARGLDLGDEVRAVINGRLVPFRITGIAVSAEYVFAIRPGDFVPDDRRFGIFWLPREDLASALDMQGAFNDLALTLAPGASGDAVAARVDSLLAPYGGRGAIPLERQLSYESLENEFRQLRVQSFLLPAIFLGVAAFLLNVVLARIIGSQRGVIAVLKAFGYHGAEVARHYLGFALLIVLLGSVVGILVGYQLGVWFVGLYAEFFRFPALGFALNPGAVAIALGVSIGSAVLGAMRAVRAAAALPPAAAMRPEAPASFEPTLLERAGLGRLLSPRGRMVLRQLGRQPRRLALAVIAIGFSMAMMVASGSIVDGVTAVIDIQFTRVQREDMAINFDRAVPIRVRHELAAIPGVLRVEPTRTAAVRLLNGHHAETIALEGRRPDTEMRQLLGADLRPVLLPPEGVLLTRWLAERLEVAPGDTVTVELIEQARRRVRVRVAGITDEPVGGGAVLDHEALARLLREQPAATGARLQIDAHQADTILERLEAMPRVAGVGRRVVWLRQFQEQLAERLLQNALVLSIFSAIIAIGVVYNNARISLAERARELGVMRVLGFTRREIAGLLLSELAVQVILAIPVGALIGIALARLVASLISTDAFRIPRIVDPSTLLSGAAVVLVSGVISALLVRRRLDQLDMVQVLKAPE